MHVGFRHCVESLFDYNIKSTHLCVTCSILFLKETKILFFGWVCLAKYYLCLNGS